jgi:hypothetical protein
MASLGVADNSPHPIRGAEVLQLCRPARNSRMHGASARLGFPDPAA